MATGIMFYVLFFHLPPDPGHLLNKSLRGHFGVSRVTKHEKPVIVR